MAVAVGSGLTVALGTGVKVGMGVKLGAGVGLGCKVCRMAGGTSVGSRMGVRVAGLGFGKPAVPPEAGAEQALARVSTISRRGNVRFILNKGTPIRVHQIYHKAGAAMDEYPASANPKSITETQAGK